MGLEDNQVRGEEDKQVRGDEDKQGVRKINERFEDNKRKG